MFRSQMGSLLTGFVFVDIDQLWRSCDSLSIWTPCREMMADGAYA
jgi:hypothetical protein